MYIGSQFNWFIITKFCTLFTIISAALCWIWLGTKYLGNYRKGFNVSSSNISRTESEFINIDSFSVPTDMHCNRTRIQTVSTALKIHYIHYIHHLNLNIFKTKTSLSRAAITIDWHGACSLRITWQWGIATSMHTSTTNTDRHTADNWWDFACTIQHNGWPICDAAS